jgi:hypothetical protein
MACVVRSINCLAALLPQECVKRMLTRDPTARATATEVLSHEWVKENGVAGDVEIEPEVSFCLALSW